MTISYSESTILATNILLVTACMFIYRNHSEARSLIRPSTFLVLNMQCMYYYLSYFGEMNILWFKIYNPRIVYQVGNVVSAGQWRWDWCKSTGRRASWIFLVSLAPVAEEINDTIQTAIAY